MIELGEDDKNYGRDEGDPLMYHSDQRDGDYISVYCPVCETGRSMWPHQVPARVTYNYPAGEGPG